MNKKSGNLATRVDEDLLSRMKAIADLDGITIEAAASEAIAQWVESRTARAVAKLQGVELKESVRPIRQKGSTG